MKRMLVSFAMAIGISAPFLSVPLQAQPIPSEVDIPFAFCVHGKTLPPGKYSVSSVTQDGTVFNLRDGEGHNVMVQLADRLNNHRETPSVTFACYAGECDLAKITPPDSSVAFANPSVQKNLGHNLGMASMISIRMGNR